MSTFAQIYKDVESRKFSPVYYLHGEETYFIDKLTQLLDKTVVNESEAAFNKNVFYGSDTQAATILNACRSFPVMANQRLVIVKEAQKLSKGEMEKLAGYLKQPVPSTILVLAFKGKGAKLPAATAKAAEKNGQAFHAKKMYERDVLKWLEGRLRDSEFEVDPKISNILVTNLGTNINLIENELEKMFVFLKATAQNTLSVDFVYEMINVDKEFNVFELIHALSERNTFQSHMIIDRLTQNEKLNPPVLVISNLYRFFSNVALVYSHKLHDPNAVKNQLGVNYYAAQDYLKARKSYPLAAVYRNIGHIQQADLKIKGHIPTQAGSRHILKTLIMEVLA